LPALRARHGGRLARIDQSVKARGISRIGITFAAWRLKGEGYAEDVLGKVLLATLGWVEGDYSARCCSTRAGCAIHTAPMATTAAIAAVAKAAV